MSEKLRQLAKGIKHEFRNEVVDNRNVVILSGTIAENFWWDDDYINAEMVREVTKNLEGDIVIRLNSAGGDVFQGIEIYNYLKSLPNRIIVEVTALAASAASIVAMAADELIMMTGSQMMIHEASTFCFGNKSDVEKVLHALESTDSSLLSIYAERTGISRDVLTNWMKEEKFFTAEEAVQAGMADKLSEEKPEPTSIEPDVQAMIDKAVKAALSTASITAEQRTQDHESQESMLEKIVKII